MMTIATRRNMKNLNVRRSPIMRKIVSNVNKMMVMRMRGSGRLETMVMMKNDVRYLAGSKGWAVMK